MSKKQRNNIVYSTNPNFNFDSNEEPEAESLNTGDQLLYVSIDRKQRGGKEVTLIENFKGPEEELKELGKVLKSKCGVGGSVKDGEIIIQGNHRDKVVKLLEQEGYRVKRKGG